MSRILVTGGAGFIGSHIVDRLLAEGQAVCVVDDLSTGLARNVSAAARFEQIDICDAEGLRATFASFKPDVVFHLAAQMDVRRSTREPEFDARVNVLGALNVLRSAVGAGTRRIVYASTGGAVYGNPAASELPVRESHAPHPVSEYGASKLAFEHYLSVYTSRGQIESATLRFPNVYGPRQRPDGEAGVIAIFTRQMLRGDQPTIFGDGKKTRDYVYVADIVDANMRAASGPSGVVANLGWGREVTDLEVFQTVAVATGYRKPPAYAPARPGEVERISIDATRARDTWGWQPTVSLHDGVRRVVEHLRSTVPELQGGVSTVAVTGAAGFIGSHVVERLLDRGDTVLGLDNFDPFYAPQEKRANLARAAGSPRFRLAEVDVADGAALRAALDTYPPPLDAVVHLAAKAGVRPSIADPVGYARVNVLGTQTVLSEAHGRGIRRFVFASSSSVYGNAATVPFNESAAAADPVSPYAATKRAGELLCRAHQHLYGGSVLCLRLFTVYGPRQRPDLAIRKFATLMSAGKPIPLFGQGSSERDYTWIDDIVDGTVAALDRTARTLREFEIVNLGGSRATDLRRLVQLLSDALGVRAVIEQLPPQPGDVERTWADISKAAGLLGYRPAVAIEEGIQRFAAWFKHEHAGAYSSVR